MKSIGVWLARRPIDFYVRIWQGRLLAWATVWAGNRLGKRGNGGRWRLIGVRGQVICDTVVRFMMRKRTTTARSDDFDAESSRGRLHPSRLEDGRNYRVVSLS